MGGWRVAALAICGLGLARVPWTSPKPHTLTVSLLQGNIEQSLKWRPELLSQSLETYLQLARDHPARLIVLPETALPTTLDDVAPDYLAQLAATAGGSGDALLGIVTLDGHGRYFNSAVSAGDPAKRYSKSHLVPFGEFTPPAFGWTLAILHIPMSDFSRGSTDQPPLDLAGEKVAVNICYEDLFGEQIIRALPEATLLVNVSNVAWFGDSLAPAQHLQIAQLRALESGRFMLRSTNTGETAVVSPQGTGERQTAHIHGRRPAGRGTRLHGPYAVRALGKCSSDHAGGADSCGSVGAPPGPAALSPPGRARCGGLTTPSLPTRMKLDFD